MVLSILTGRVSKTGDNFEHMNTIMTHHLVRSEDLNHHNTLYAGRAADWFIEVGYMAVEQYLPSSNVVCAKIEETTFFKSIYSGETVRIESGVIYAAGSRLVSYIATYVGEEKRAEGYITFAYVGEYGHSKAHGIAIEAETEGEIAQQERAKKMLC